VVSFNLMLAVQSCADIASHVIADQGWPPASNLAGRFNRLRDEQVLSPATAASLCKAVGLRNVVAHGRRHCPLPAALLLVGLAALVRRRRATDKTTR